MKLYPVYESKHGVYGLVFIYNIPDPEPDPEPDPPPPPIIRISLPDEKQQAQPIIIPYDQAWYHNNYNTYSSYDQIVSVYPYSTDSSSVYYDYVTDYQPSWYIDDNFIPSSLYNTIEKLAFQKAFGTDTSMMPGYACALNAVIEWDGINWLFVGYAGVEGVTQYSDIQAI